MHAGGVQRIVPVADPQEAGALLECLGAQPGNFQQCPAVAEPAGLVAVGDDGLGQRLGDARHPGQQRHRRCVEVHAHGVDGILDHGSQAAGQDAGRHVVLVLPDPDRLRLDLDQLGQRILQPPRDRDRAPQCDVEIG